MHWIYTEKSKAIAYPQSRAARRRDQVSMRAGGKVPQPGFHAGPGAGRPGFHAGRGLTAELRGGFKFSFGQRNVRWRS